MKKVGELGFYKWYWINGALKMRYAGKTIKVYARCFSEAEARAFAAFVIKNLNKVH